MANTFDISVKTEIAAVKAVVDAIKVILLDVHDTDLPAAVTKIDANKTVIDENKVILVDVHDTDLPAAKTVIDENKVILADVHDTDLPAVKTDTSDIRTKVTSIHDTDLPAAVTKIDDNKAVVDAIRSTDVPNIQTNIDANETKIDANANTLQAIHTTVSFTVSVSDNLLFSADTERSVLGVTYTKVKEIRIDYPGTYRFTFNTKVDGANFGFAKVYKDGAPFGVEKSFDNQAYPNVESDDLVFATGELAQLYLKNGGAADNTFAKEFRVKGDFNNVIEPVIID